MICPVVILTGIGRAPGQSLTIPVTIEPGVFTGRLDTEHSDLCGKRKHPAMFVLSPDVRDQSHSISD